MRRPEQFSTVLEFVKSNDFKSWLGKHSTKEIHNCYDCPHIQEELEEKLLVDSLCICRYYSFDSFIEDLRKMCDNCWCEKVGSRVWVEEVSDNKRCPRRKEV